MKPHIIQIVWGVSELSRAIEFYRDKIGFPLILRSDEHSYARFDAGGIHLGLVAGEGDPSAGPRAAVTIGVEDLEAAHSELSDKGVEFQMPPTRQPWGATLARFADPDGNLLYLEAVSGS